MLLVFASKSCAIYNVVHRACDKLAPHWSRFAEIVILYDEEVLNVDGGNGLFVLGGSKLRERLDVYVLPYGVMLDMHGNTLGKGLLNTATHVESLLELLVRSLESNTLPEDKNTNMVKQNEYA